MERLKVFDILHHDFLCQVNITFENDMHAVQLFALLSEKGIRIKFLVVQTKHAGSVHLTFCVERSSFKTTQEILFKLGLEEDSSLFPDAGMVAVYGPHFGEKPGIIDAMYNVLEKNGVNVFAISTTISTSFFVVSASQVMKAVEILKEVFEIPKGIG